MPTEQENCHLVTVTEEEINNSVRVIPRLDTLILVKAMGHRKRFGNPFRAQSTTNTSKELKYCLKNSKKRNPLYPINSTNMSLLSANRVTNTKSFKSLSISDSEMNKNKTTVDIK